LSAIILLKVLMLNLNLPSWMPNSWKKRLCRSSMLNALSLLHVTKRVISHCWSKP